MLLIASCGQQPTVTFHEVSDPEALSDWGLFSVSNGYLTPSPGTTTFTLNSVLFSDYAHKLRTIWVPPQTSITSADGETLNFPTGTIITKTFFYPDGRAGLLKVTDQGQFIDEHGIRLDETRVIETRLLVKREDGWAALAYVWNDEESEAALSIIGDERLLDIGTGTFTYIVPDRNQCSSCHVTNLASKAINPIGPTLSNLHRGEQLNVWQKSGLIDTSTIPKPMADWRNENIDVSYRARSYLHMNCAHCHSQVGPADTSGLYLTLDEQDMIRLGRCKLPIAAGQGTGGHAYSIVPGKPNESILVYRMRTLDPGAMMPEVGRSVVHNEGITLVSAWIEALEGDC